MTALRPYQQTCLTQLRASYASGRKRPLLVSPTGSGKTVLFSAVTKGAAERGNRVLILAHRQELLDQISEALERENVQHGFCAAGYPKRYSSGVIVAGVQTLVNRLEDVPAPDLIITDEAHHSVAGSYLKIYAAYPGARLLGVTATPCRTSGEGLRAVYDDMILGPPVTDLIEAGYLSRYRAFAPPTVDTTHLHIRAGDFIPAEVDALMNRPAVYGSAIEHYRQHADGKRAVIYSYNIEHASSMASQFRDSGYRAAVLTGGTDKSIRRQMNADFRSGALQILASVDVISEGYDLPAIECGIFMRPTASLSLWLQQVGRCLRPFPGKDAAILLDHAQNTYRHGLPDDDRDWSLDGEPKAKRKAADKSTSVRLCPKCWAANKSGIPRCRSCGHVFEVQSREVDEKGGTLKELTPEELAERKAKRDARREQGRAQSLEALREIEHAKGYRKGWADHVYRARQQQRGAS